MESSPNTRGTRRGRFVSLKIAMTEIDAYAKKDNKNIVTSNIHKGMLAIRDILKQQEQDEDIEALKMDMQAQMRKAIQFMKTTMLKEMQQEMESFKTLMKTELQAESKALEVQMQYIHSHVKSLKTLMKTELHAELSALQVQMQDMQNHSMCAWRCEARIYRFRSDLGEGIHV